MVLFLDVPLPKMFRIVVGIQFSYLFLMVHSANGSYLIYGRLTFTEATLI